MAEKWCIPMWESQQVARGIPKHCVPSPHMWPSPVLESRLGAVWPQPRDPPHMASQGNGAEVSARAVFWFGVSSCFHGREFPFLTKDKGKKKEKEVKKPKPKKKNHPVLIFCQKNGMFPFLFWLLAAPNCSQWKKISVWKRCWPPPRSAMAVAGLGAPVSVAGRI